MIWMILGLVIFLGSHLLLVFATGWRDEQVARLGKNLWRALFSLVAITGFVLLVWGFGQMRQSPIVLWHPPVGLRHGVSLLMLPAFILLVAAYFPANHIRARLGHPMVLSVKLWAFAHLLVNGRLGDLVFFGAFLVWGILMYVGLRRRDRTAGVLPPVGQALNTVVTVILGAVLWYLFAMHLHVYVAGVPAIAMG